MNYENEPISSKEMSRRTGLSLKTITRRHQAGIISEPEIRTHPSGRGKLGYFPASEADRLLLIEELRAEGRSLQSAVQKLDDDVDEIVAEIARPEEVSAALTQARLMLPGADDLNKDDLLHRALQAEIRASVEEDDLRERLAEGFTDQLMNRAFRMASDGISPVLLSDGSRVEVEADFIIPHRLSENLADVVYTLIPLYGILRRTFGRFGVGEELPEKPTTRPVPRVSVREGRTVLEYDLYVGGEFGFELLRDSVRTVGSLPEPVDSGSFGSSRVRGGTR